MLRDEVKPTILSDTLQQDENSHTTKAAKTMNPQLLLLFSAGFACGFTLNLTPLPYIPTPSLKPGTRHTRNPAYKTLPVRMLIL